MKFLGRGLDALLPGDEDEQLASQQPQSVPHDPTQPVDDAQGKPPVSSANLASVPSLPVVSERPKESVFWIETIKIRPNPEQPRTQFDQDRLQELAQSIKEYGILQPIIVTRQEIELPNGRDVQYQLIAGERRYRAATIIGLEQVPAIIRREETERTKLELALIENVQREDLNPLEKARAYKRLMDDFKLMQREVAARVGKSREAIANTMRLLQLPEYIQVALADSKISEGHARGLLSLATDPAEQSRVFEAVIAGTMNVRDVERAARDFADRKKEALSQVDSTDPKIRVMEEELGTALGTRVAIRREKGGRGHIAITFFSEEEFQHLAEKFAKLREEAKFNPGSVPPPNNVPDNDMESFTV